MSMSRRDPAEQNGYLRYFYRNWRPTRLGRLLSRAYGFASGMGLTSDRLLTLQFKQRTSGQLRSVILAVVHHEGQRYLVSMLGNGSTWVENVRAAGGAAFVKRGQSRPVMLRELPPENRAPIIKAWSQRASSGRKHLPVEPGAPLSAFQAIAADYPVFRIEAVPAASPARSSD
ncbi:hypothetical protein [Bradyrhizobium sp.]|uniref:hypothetical protein n=1 Tax=Bradyrhizobium sp. TaxID=376 RepID=UPI003C611352